MSSENIIKSGGGGQIYGLQDTIGTLRTPLSEQKEEDDLLTFFFLNEYETELVMLTYSLFLFL